MSESKYTFGSAIILGMSETGEEIPAAAGRISTQEGTAREIFEKSHDGEKNARLIAKVTRSGHNSTIEHTVFNIAFENVSVFAEQFLIEFRLASFTVKSRRYVNFGSSGYCVPPLKSEDNRKAYVSAMDELFRIYARLIESGVPKEDARFVLPYCLNSNFYCTVNARELLNILRAMLYGRGSAFDEIRLLGSQLLEQLERLTPGIVTDFDKRRPNASDKIGIGYMFSGDGGAAAPSEEKVSLLSFTPDAEKCVARAALIWERQYGADTVERIISDEENVRKIVKLVCRSSRPRPLETVGCTFRLNGVSLSSITHFARHRMHSLMVPSLTLTDRRRYIVPETVRACAQALESYERAFDIINTLYESLKADGLSEEQLVYCQLSGNTLDIVSSMNARELLLFMKLRTCSRAQWEIREYAVEMLKALRKRSPMIFDNYGPSCYVSSCPEGALSCGRMSEIKDFFNNLK